MAKSKVVYHTCGRKLLMEKVGDKFVFRDTSFMSAPVTLCPDCKLTILASDMGCPTKFDKSEKHDTITA